MANGFYYNVNQGGTKEFGAYNALFLQSRGEKGQWPFWT